MNAQDDRNETVESTVLARMQVEGRQFRGIFSTPSSPSSCYSSSSSSSTLISSSMAWGLDPGQPAPCGSPMRLDAAIRAWARVSPDAQEPPIHKTPHVSSSHQSMDTLNETRDQCSTRDDASLLGGRKVAERVEEICSAPASVVRDFVCVRRGPKGADGPREIHVADVDALFISKGMAKMKRNSENLKRALLPDVRKFYNKGTECEFFFARERGRSLVRCCHDCRTRFFLSNEACDEAGDFPNSLTYVESVRGFTTSSEKDECLAMNCRHGPKTKVSSSASSSNSVSTRKRGAAVSVFARNSTVSARKRKVAKGEEEDDEVVQGGGAKRRRANLFDGSSRSSNKTETRAMATTQVTTKSSSSADSIQVDFSLLFDGLFNDDVVDS